MARILLFLVLFCLPTALAAQGSILRVYPDVRSISSLATGDVDGDSHPDIVVGLANDAGPWPFGAVVAYSGRDGSVLFTQAGQGRYDRFGYSVATGDLNGDGCSDIVVGTDYGAVSNPSPTLVEAYSGRDGSRLWAMPWPVGESASARLYPVWTGDFDGDTRDDVAITMDSGGAYPTHLYLVSGVDGTVLAMLSEPAVPAYGRCVGVGRFDSDAIDDLLIADGYAIQPVQLISGAHHALIRTLPWPRPPAASPATPPALAGDVNRDGIDDVVFGWVDGPPMYTGTAIVYSGADGSTLHTWVGGAPYSRFGDRVAAAGDVDGDGNGDVIVTASPLSQVAPASAQVFSGADGTELMSLVEYWQSGGALRYPTSAGDVDGDGKDDVLFAQSDLGSPTSSRVELAVRGLGVPVRFSRHGTPYEMRVPVGIGVRVPTEDVLGHTMTVSLRGAQAYSGFTALLIGPRAAVPLDMVGMLGATLRVQPMISVVVTPVSVAYGPSASADLALTWPDSPALVGVSVEMQWVHEDQWAPNPLRLALTEALTVQLH